MFDRTFGDSKIFQGDCYREYFMLEIDIIPREVFPKYTEVDQPFKIKPQGNKAIERNVQGSRRIQAVPGNDQNASPTNQKTTGSKLDRR